MSQTNSQSTQAEECGVSKISAEWSEIVRFTKVETPVQSHNVFKEKRSETTSGVSVNTSDCKGTLTITDGKRYLTATITSAQLRELADAQDAAVEYEKKVYAKHGWVF